MSHVTIIAVTIIAYYLLNLQKIPCSDLMILPIFRYMVIPKCQCRNADDSQTILEYVVEHQIFFFVLPESDYFCTIRYPY